MFANVFRREVSMMRTATILWVLGLCLLAGMYFSVYPTFTNDADTMRGVFSSMPEAFRKTMNVDIDKMLSFLGYYSFTMNVIGLVAACAATSIGMVVMTREKSSKTVDFLLTKPVSRTSLFVQKICAGVFMVLTVSISYGFLSYAIAVLAGASNIDIAIFSLLNVALLLVMLSFFAIGVLVAQLARKIRSVTAATIAVSFGFFAIGTVLQLTDAYKAKYLSPIQFFSYTDIVTDGTLHIHGVAMSVLVLFVCAGAAYIVYNNRDVPSLT